MVVETDPNLWGYGRASTKKQEASPDVQKQKIKDYAKFFDLKGDVTFFIDAATSGKIAIEDRPAGSQLFKNLRPGDHVIITGNPGRNPDDHRARMVNLVRPSDGFKWGGHFD